MDDDELKMELAELTQLGANLQTIHDAFSAASDQHVDWSGLTGETRFAQALDGFDGKWRIKRTKMLENIASMQQLITGVVGSFTNLDADLNGALSGDEPGN